jgi:hypothetical protein
MTRDESRIEANILIREMTRAAFGVWVRPNVQRLVRVARFVVAVARDEWWLLENPPGPAKTDEELTIEALANELRARGANGEALNAAKHLYAAGATKIGAARDNVRAPEGRDLARKFATQSGDE